MMDQRNMAVRSCSTMVALGNMTQSGNLIFAKNSDRAVNESQPLCFYPARTYPKGSLVNCTFIQIPQVEKTYACIGSRPYNLFGFEHGVNEHGLVIGNEAVMGREAPERKWGLLGMDILRLALERCKTASEAVYTIGNLLEMYGTGGDPAYRIPAFNANYIIADAKEAYLFESCQREWTAKKVKNTGNIGNCYSIGDDYDIIGQNVVAHCADKGWVSSGAAASGGKINAAKAFALDDCFFTEAESYFRFNRVKELLSAGEKHTAKSMMDILRDHYDGTDYGRSLFSIATAKLPAVCSHPGGMGGCATAASVVCELDEKAPAELRYVFWGSMAPPCCSIFRPYFNIGFLPEQLQHAHALYRNSDQWWIFTELERYIALNYEVFSPGVRSAFGALENELIEMVSDAKKTFDGNKEKLKKITIEADERSLSLAKRLLKEIKVKCKTAEVDTMLLRYFRESAEGCGMPYEEIKGGK